MMQNKKTIFILCLVITVLAGIAAAGAFLLEDGRQTMTYETARGQNAQLYGGGLYRYDTVFFREGNRASDLLVLVLEIPLLLFILVAAQKGSRRARLLLSGLLAYILYLYASLALGTAYNPFFLLYIAILSASLFAFIANFNMTDMPEDVSGMPRKSLSVFMIASGLITLVVWCQPLISALLTGTAPLRMDSYTTMVTYVLDLAVITPATFICAAFVLKNDPRGYKLALVLLSVIILLVPQIILATYFQYTGGVSFSPGEMIGPVAGFLTLGLLAAWLLRAVLKEVN